MGKTKNKHQRIELKNTNKSGGSNYANIGTT